MSQILGLVLTGGGARAAYQVGVLKALEEIIPGKSCPFKVLCGTSAGAINTAYLASHAGDWKNSVESLHKLWSQLSLNQVYRTDSISLSRIAFEWITRTILGGKGGTRKRANYLLSTEPLWRLLANEVNFQEIRRLIECKELNAVTFSSVHYFTGTTVSFFDAASNAQDWTRSNRMGVRCKLHAGHVMASASIPIFFPPVKIEQGYYGDGCLRQTTPLSPAIHLGSDKMISIGIRPDRKKIESRAVMLRDPRHSPSLAEISGELMNSLFLDSMEADVERLETINESISKMPKEYRSTHFGSFKEIPILQLKPSRDLGELVPDVIRHFPPTLRYLLKGLGVSADEGKELISYLAFIGDCVNPLMQLGYQDTIHRSKEIDQFINS